MRVRGVPVEKRSEFRLDTITGGPVGIWIKIHLNPMARARVDLDQHLTSLNKHLCINSVSPKWTLKIHFASEKLNLAETIGE